MRAQEELLRRQEELERKAAELDRREREMQSLSASGGELLKPVLFRTAHTDTASLPLLGTFTQQMEQVSLI